MGERGDHTSIDVSALNRQLATSITMKLGSLPPSPFGEHCRIFRVDKKFRKTNEDAFTPKVFPIGPFHHDKIVTLQAVEDHKLRYMNALLSRTANRDTKLQECIEAISSKEDEARKCYSESVEPDRNKFIQMMIVDGLFIIEVFRRSAGEVEIDRGDPIFNNIGILSSTVHDMVLLENQLPMFVLQELFRITTENRGGKSLNELAIRFFNRLMRRDENVLRNCFNKAGKHLLDLLRETFLDRFRGQAPNNDPNFKLIPSAKDLRLAGVMFEVVDGRNLLDVTFIDGVMKIPRIIICDETDFLLRNFIALEQCGDGCDTSYMTSYAFLMGSLIDSSADVGFLRRTGIIKNYLGDDESVSSLFNKLSSEVTIGQFYYTGLCDQVNAFHTSPWHKWRSDLKRYYFDSPWTVYTFVSGYILLILAFTSAICDVLNLKVTKT